MSKLLQIMSIFLLLLLLFLGELCL